VRDQSKIREKSLKAGWRSLGGEGDSWEEAVSSSQGVSELVRDEKVEANTL